MDGGKAFIFSLHVITLFPLIVGNCYGHCLLILGTSRLEQRLFFSGNQALQVAKEKEVTFLCSFRGVQYKNSRLSFLSLGGQFSKCSQTQLDPNNVFLRTEGEERAEGNPSCGFCVGRASGYDLKLLPVTRSLLELY